MISRTQVRVVLAAVVAAIGTLAGAAPASAVNAGTCVMADLGGALLLDPWPTVTPEAAVDLPAGEVSIPEAVSTDSYPERVDVTQSSEIWELQFIAADGSVIATSSPTPDLPDFVESASWSGSLGTVTLSEPAVAIRANHRPDIAPDGSPNSVHPTGITLCFESPSIDPPSDGDCLLNEDGSFADPTDPDCPAPPAPAPPAPDCPLNDDGTPVDPADPDCPPTPAPPAPPATDCPLNDDGTPVDASDPDCPTPDPLPPTQQPPAQPAPTPEPTLPVTGASSTLFALSGAWLLAAGAALMAFGRSRRTA